MQCSCEADRSPKHEIVRWHDQRKPNLTESRLKLHLTIIVAEDVGEIRDFVCLFLETAGYLVLPAANGQAALQVASDFGGPIDLLLADLDTPGGSGLELAKTLLKVYPRIRVLLMSEAYDPSTAQILGEAANRLFLPKPFSRQELLQTVEEALS